MAIYKPSNFYPHLQEVDLTKQDGNTFSCQVNTDGGFVSGARLNIYTEDNVLVYDDLYQFSDGETIKNSISDKEFAQFSINPYLLNSIQYNKYEEFTYKRYVESNGKNVYYDEYGKNGEVYTFYNESKANQITEITLADGSITTDQIKTEKTSDFSKLKNQFIIPNINFTTLNPANALINASCPYDFYNVKIKDTFCFGLKIIDNDNNEFLYEIKNVEYSKNQDDINFNVVISFPYDEKDNALDGLFTKIENNINNYSFYIVLLNNKDYSWDVKLYEHPFGKMNDNKRTLVTDGYVTGSTKSVLWWNTDKQTDNTLFNKKEIKEDYYIEIIGNEENSDLFDEQKKIGRVSSGQLTKDNIGDNKTSLKFENCVNLQDYKIENLFLYIEFTDDLINEYYTTYPEEKDKKNLSLTNYLKIGTINKEKKDNKDITYIQLEDMTFYNIIIKMLSFENNSIINIKYYFTYKQREKISWTTKDVGFDKKINKIEVENDFNINLKDGEIVNLYGGNDINTNYTFFGVRDSDINVNDIYVRFPGYIGADFNGNAINDNQPYYVESGTAKEIYDSSGKKVELVSNIGLKGNFYNGGIYYDNEKASHKWSNSEFVPISLYGKSVSYKNFEKNDEQQSYGYLNIFNPETIGTAYCHTAFFIELYNNYNNWIAISVDGEKYSFDVDVPTTSPDSEKYKGWLFFYIDNNGDWNVQAIQNDGWGTKLGYTTDDYWNLTDYPKPSKKGDYFEPATINEQWGKCYNIGKINNIKIYISKNISSNSNPTISFYYYSNEVCQKENNKVILSDVFDVDKYLPKNYNTTTEIKMTDNTVYYYPNVATFPASYCKLFKVTSYDYETGEFVIAGGLERSILNTDKYEVWRRVASEDMNNEYNITEIRYSYDRIYPPNDKYDEVAYVGDTKILRDGIRIMNNTDKQIFIQPNVNFESDEFNYPYLILDNYNEKIEFPYKSESYDNGVIIEDKTIDKLDNSQWLLKYSGNLSISPKPGLTYKLYMDTCRSNPSSWFYGRNLIDINMYVGEYNFIMSKIDSDYKPSEIYEKKKNFRNMEYEKIGDYCLIKCVDAYFMATYDNLSVPIKRYRFRIYDSNMNLVSDSQYVYSTNVNYGVRGFRNYENYLLTFELEDQLGYVYNYEQKFTVKYTEWLIDDIRIDLVSKDSQGCIIGDFVTLREVTEDEIISQRDTYDEDGNKINKGSIIPKGTFYYDLVVLDDFRKLGLNDNDDIHIYRRDSNKILFSVCDINLTSDKIITGNGDNNHRYGFIDYGVHSNEYYDYVVILKQKDKDPVDNKYFTDMTYWCIENRCKTQFNGWLLTDIEKDDSNDKNYYVSDFVWNFRYNLESQDLTQNTSVTQWNTLGKYANTYIGERNFISSGLSCLLGDVGTYLTYDGKNIHDKFGYFEQSNDLVNYDDIYNVYSTEVLTNKIDKYLQWKAFVNNGNEKLLKDYKGNIWIVQILENPSVKNNDSSQEQVYTLSFNWIEIDDWKKYSILGKNISYNIDESIIDNLQKNYLPMWNFNYDNDLLLYTLIDLNVQYDYSPYKNYNMPLLVNGILTIDTKGLYGVLSESYNQNNICFSNYKTEDDVLENTIEDQYTKIKNGGSFHSPFMIRNQENKFIYPSDLSYIDFESSLNYEHNSIDFICCTMNNLKGVNIVLTDTIKTARYAFAKTSIKTDEKYKIIISTNNYIDTKGIFDDVIFSSNDDCITVIWNESANDPNVLLYAELYEQYWNNDHIILDCPKLNFVLSEYDYIIQDNTIILNEYKGNSDLKTSLYIPTNIKQDINNDGIKETYKIILSSNFVINK